MRISRETAATDGLLVDVPVALGLELHVARVLQLQEPQRGLKAEGALAAALRLADLRGVEMAGRMPILEPLRLVYEHVTALKSLQPLPLCSDGRVRLGMREEGWRHFGVDPSKEKVETGSVGFGAYRAKSGRNQPKAVEFIPAQASWWRGIITPSPGRVLCYYDYKSQEYGIAAYLSGDETMMADYANGEVYIPLGIRSGLLPPDATKDSHKQFRNEKLKPILLGLQYGRQAPGIADALSAGNPRVWAANHAIAKQVLERHRMTHAAYWRWVEQSRDEAQLRGFIETTLGWRMKVGDPKFRLMLDGEWTEVGETKELTLANFPMQAGGGDIMRLACAALTHEGIDVITPVHDALLFECDLQDLEDVGRRAAYLMEEASRVVLGPSCTIPVDTAPKDSLIHKTGDWVSSRGASMWKLVTTKLGLEVPR